ncbi:acetoacetate--CoA ligase [Thermomonospora curvata]|uniref:Acetoacetyl-CoA synthase n=1 Tax=Thermomonospora curvata (strain ATCC 19995 / DSM 43183 / JCM 3096 / KCTC 9072 / NBRC 15933 / NCIMB 10081 / Henssen B9) TaxID=471852 RepID=D1AEZ9_THECD|nr:acetoacetate--CoA ligase [Thermomonospora curvata]ACY99543.1 acetoacetyl-CoA synthase [Thermomonospora curvata DSM 43183]
MAGNEAASVQEGRQDAAQGRVLWEPPAEVIERAQLTRYRRWLAERGLGPGAQASYQELWRWSVTEIDAFWDSLWSYFDVVGTRGDGPVRRGGPMPVDGLRWFPGATVNYAANALRGAVERPEEVAVVFRSEAGGHRVLTRGELAHQVARVRAGLAGLGVGKGDRVAAYLPNIPEALICFLATASLGAIWSSCSPDFGSASVIDRFAQIEPKVLIAVDGYVYGGRRFDRRAVVAEIEAALPSLSATVLIPYLDPAASPDGLLRNGVAYADLPRPGHDLAFEEVPFDHPLWVVYSSGTTGLPKPIVHGHGGIVLEHLKALSFHQDLGPGDVFCWYTTTGWMMWNYLIGGLLVGATVVLYDGAPKGDELWRLSAELGVTYLGVGAPYIMASRKAGLRPGAEYDLSRLRGIGSTGSPLPPEGFEWVYAAVGSDLLLGSFSGGTDVCTGFVGPCPLLPLRAGVIQCRGLGAKVEAYDEDGKPVVDQVGELVLTEPMPSMPVFFWNDPDGARYRGSYFEGFAGAWRHGDWVKILPDGGCVIYGRSDSTLNRGGVRMGTSDFYRVVEAFDEVVDSLVIDTGRLGQEGRLLLYVQLAEGVALDEELAGRIRQALRTALSPRHVPDEIRQVPGVPRTLSGKKLEIPVRKILLGTPVEKAANPGSMANPEVLEHYRP